LGPCRVHIGFRSPSAHLSLPTVQLSHFDHSRTSFSHPNFSYNIMSLLLKVNLLSAVFCLTAAVIAVISIPQSILSNWKPGNKATILKAEEKPNYETPLASCPKSNQDHNQNYVVMLRSAQLSNRISPSSWSNLRSRLFILLDLLMQNSWNAFGEIMGLSILLVIPIGGMLRSKWYVF
jgi:hypothetical protein